MAAIAIVGVLLSKCTRWREKADKQGLATHPKVPEV